MPLPPDAGPSPPWWLWPNVLALDAPAVAVAWQRFLADRLGGPSSAAVSVALGLTVWGLYLGDRWLDARRGTVRADRHRFAGRYPWLVAGVAAACLTTAVGLTAAVPPGVLIGGAAIGLVAAGYFAAVHFGVLPGDPAGAKELLVGTLFAAGVMLPAAAARPAGWPAWGPAFVGLAGLFGLNCVLISRWEAGAGERRPAGWVAVAAGLAAAAGAAGCEPRVGAATGAALVLLGLLHLARGRLGPRRLRTLADAVLLTPLVAGVWP